MNTIKNKLKHMFREELDIRFKLLNLILLAAFLGGCISFFVSFVIGVHISSLITMALVILVVGFTLWMANKKERPQSAALILVVVANVIIFPIMYFTSGGMQSGMPIWLVLGMIFSWLLLSGPVCLIMYGINVVVVIICVVLEVYFPQMIIPLEGEYAPYWDMLQSMIVVTCIFGLIFKYQTYVYEKKKKQLLEANRAKSEFLAQMSHEIRTPINAVLGYNEMVLKESKESHTVSYAIKIQKSGKHLLSLVNDIFGYVSKEKEDYFYELGQEDKTEFFAPNVKILAVDDNNVNLDLFCGMLKDSNIQIDTAENGMQALELLRKEQYHMVFMDHMMPVMDGIETIHKIKEEKLCENIPIIILTANAVGNVKEEYLAEGFDDYLCKPILSKELISVIQKYLPVELTEKKENIIESPFPFLDTKTGMEYCCNNEDFYREMLKSYLTNSKIETIITSFEEEDWEQYRILVHALKSTSLSIGAIEVSEDAKKLEMAAKENRISDIKKEHATVMEKYQKLLNQLTNALQHTDIQEESCSKEAEDKERILVVDDDAMNLQIAEKMLEADYVVDCVESGKLALDYLKNTIPNLILLDLHMPQMDGFEVNRQIKQTAILQEIPVVFLTADHDRETEIKGFHEGALDFITKPFVADIMLQRIKRILELDRLQKNLQAEVEKQTRTAEARRQKVERLSMQIMTTLADTIDAKDKYTNGHSIRVAEYAKEIAKRAGKSLQEQEDIYYVGLLHDIGKIGIPNAIINKTTRLTDEEYELIKSHTTIGAEILSNMTEIPGLPIGAHWHHELYNGKGYPDGLKGEEIPEMARIIGVADAYDAMASKRSYRDVLPQQIVREELVKGRGSQFDPKFADIMIQMIDEDKEYRLHE